MKFSLMSRPTIVLLLMMVSVATYSQVQLINYGDARADELFQQLRDLNSGTSTNTIHLVQFGDSHTGGDYFTGRLRELLQEKMGNAGMGWLTPGDIKNQRSDQIGLKNSGRWKLIDSKNRQVEEVFPIGGLFNFADTESLVEVKSKKTLAPGKWRVSLWYQSQQIPFRIAFDNSNVYKFPIAQKNSNAWQLTNLDFNHDRLENFRLLAPQKTKLGAIVMDRLVPGVTLDALGNNGSVAAVMSRWDANTIEQQLRWRNPHLIILAYGTNEAFDGNLMIVDYETELRNNIRRFRNYAPKAAILILGVPSSTKKSPPHLIDRCNFGLPPSLVVVQQIQRRVAKEEHTLYWDWAEFMGGACGAEQWANLPTSLMRPDMIHLSQEGYVRSAEGLFNAIVYAVARP